MNTKQKILTLIAGTLLATSSLNATSFGAEAFYGIAQKDLITLPSRDVLRKTDIAGLNLRASQSLDQFKFGAFTPEVYGIVGFGTGSEDITTIDDSKVDADVLMMQAMVGANLTYSFSEKFSAYAGIKLGLGYMNTNLKYSTENEEVTYGNDDIGINYGIGIGFDYALTPEHSIYLGADYLATTARPEISLGETFKTKEQSYLIFTVGYKYSF